MQKLFLQAELDFQKFADLQEYAKKKKKPNEFLKAAILSNGPEPVSGPINEDDEQGARDQRNPRVLSTDQIQQYDESMIRAKIIMERQADLDKISQLMCAVHQITLQAAQAVEESDAKLIATLKQVGETKLNAKAAGDDIKAGARMQGKRNYWCCLCWILIIGVILLAGIIFWFYWKKD